MAEAEYHFVHDGVSDIGWVQTATPNAATHAEVLGALTRYGYVGSVHQYLLQEGEAAPSNCISHQDFPVWAMVEAYRKDNEPQENVRPSRDAGLMAVDQIAYNMFGGYRTGEVRGREAKFLGDQEASYGYIESEIFVNGKIRGFIAIGTHDPEEHALVAKAVRFFSDDENFAEELTYKILPFITANLEHSQLDMATYPPATISAAQPVVRAIIEEYRAKKDPTKRWRVAPRERTVPKRQAGKRARAAILGEDNFGYMAAIPLRRRRVGWGDRPLLLTLLMLPTIVLGGAAIVS